MSSLCRNPDQRWATTSGAVLLALLAAVPAYAQNNPARESGPPFVPVTTIFPGDGAAPRPDPLARAYQGNPKAIAAGKRLFSWYNCDGCHANGGGGIGPALMDKTWRYGGSMDDIFASIAQGRPNGMPSWHGKISDADIWKLAAFVKSLSTPSGANGPGQTIPKPPAPPLNKPPLPKSGAPGVKSTP